MSKVLGSSPIINFLNGEPIRNSDNAEISFKDVVTSSLNQPPAAFGADGGSRGRNAKQAAELRMGILRKMHPAPTGKPDGNVTVNVPIEFLPEEKDEILFCVAAIQPPVIFEGVKQVLESTNGDTPPDTQTDEPAAEIPVQSEQ